MTSYTNESPACREQAGPQNNLSTGADQAVKTYTDTGGKATKWLRELVPEGPINIVTANVENFGATVATRTFTDDDAAMTAHIDAEHTKGRDVYWQVNGCTADNDGKGKRPSKKDVTYIRGVHLDFDFKDIDPNGRLDAKMRKKLEEEAFDRILEGKWLGPKRENRPPTALTMSGKGFHGYWMFDKPLEPTPENVARVEAIGRHIITTLKAGKGTHDISRILRVAFTINFKPGRDGAFVSPCGGSGARYSPDDFSASVVKLPPAKKTTVIDPDNVAKLANVDALDNWNVPARVKVIILQGHHPEEPKESDNSRSAWLFDAVCNMLRAGVPDDVVYSVITDPQFGISESVLDRNSQAHRYALKQIASAKEHIDEPWLARLNDRYFVVPVGGKTLVGNFEPVIVAFDKRGKPIMRDAISYRSLQAFQDLYESEKIEVGITAKGAPILMEVGKWWRKNNKRRQYEGVAFRPDSLEEIVDGKLNTFRGFACEATEGDKHIPFKQFVLEVVCNRDSIVFDYLWKWIANAVQSPGRIGEVAIGLRGLKGTGKTFFAAVVAHLFGQHGLVTGDGNLLVGKFNAPLEMLCMLVMDEAHVFTDQRSRGIVKTRVTGATIDIERKGVDLVTVPNCLHLMFISNDEQFLDASDDERRYLALTVSDEHKDDFAYFEALQHGLDEGGYGDLLGELMSLELSGFNVRRVPKTDELRRQAGLASSGTPIAERVAEVLDTIPFGCFKLGELCEFLGLEIKGSNDSQFRDVKKALISAGYEHGKRTPIGEHEQSRVWFKTGMPLARVRLFRKPIEGTCSNFDDSCFEWPRKDHPAIEAALMEQFGPYFGPWFLSAYLGKAQGITITGEERSRLHAKALESLAVVVKGVEGPQF